MTIDNIPEEQKIVYVPTPIEENPKKVGYYVTNVNDKGAKEVYWNGEEWRFYRNVPEKAVGLTNWLRPTTLPQEIKDLEQTIVDYDKAVIELRQENERLRGLAQLAWYSGLARGYHDGKGRTSTVTKEGAWEQFKKQNNL